MSGVTACVSANASASPTIPLPTRLWAARLRPARRRPVNRLLHLPADPVRAGSPARMRGRVPRAWCGSSQAAPSRVARVSRSTVPLEAASRSVPPWRCTDRRGSWLTEGRPPRARTRWRSGLSAAAASVASTSRPFRVVMRIRPGVSGGLVLARVRRVRRRAQAPAGSSRVSASWSAPTTESRVWRRRTSWCGAGAC